MSGYIKMQKVTDHTPVPELSQYNNYKDLEAKLSPKGIKILSGTIVDEDIEV